MSDTLSTYELQLILKKRGITEIEGIILTPGKIKSMKKEDLVRAIGPMVEDRELVYLDELKKTRVDYIKTKLDDLKKICAELGVGVSGTKDELIDNILVETAKSGRARIELDDDQKKVLQDVKSSKYMNVCANAGCGKSILLAAIVQSLLPERFLILTYTRNSRNIIIANLAKFRIKIGPNIIVNTFDEFCARTMTATVNEEDEDDLDEEEENFTFSEIRDEAITRVSAMTLENVLIDEAQDAINGKLCDTLKSRSKRFILMGDLQQQLYGGAWYETQLITHTLGQNHRSSKHIVNYLNNFTKKDNIIGASLEGKPVKIIEVPEKKYIKFLSEGIKNRIINDCVGLLINEPSMHTYVIFPFTLKHDLYKELRQEICNRCPGTHFSTSKLSPYSNMLTYTCQVKGSEADRIIIINDLQKPQSLPFLYTAISRARRECIIYNCSPLQLPVGECEIHELPQNISSISHFDWSKFIQAQGSETIKINLTRSSTQIETDLKTVSPLRVRYLQVMEATKALQFNYKKVNLGIKGKIAALDIETIRFGGHISEVALVGNSTIAHIVAEGIEEIPTDYEGEEFDFVKSTGLKPKNVGKIAGCQEKLLKSMGECVEGITVIKFSGSDEKILPAGTKVIDLMNVFKVWLSLNGLEEKRSMNLRTLVEDFYGPFNNYKAHRAFEDALFTYAIFTLIVM